METRLLVPSLGVVLGLLSGSSVLAAEGNDKVTFNKDVAPIMFKHCAVCHRPGGKGPMSLLTYEKARPFGRKIQEKIVAREMPPWGADPGYRKLLNDPSLSQQEIDTVVAWVKGGVLEGNPKDLPPAPGTVEGWTIGQPDVIYPMPEPFKVPAQGVLDLQVFYVSPPFPEDRWIQRIEVVPGNRSVVHHSTISLKAPGVEVKHNRANPLPGVIILPPEQNNEEWAEYKPAKIEIANKMNRVRAEDLPSWSPPGTAVFVPAGSRLMLQMHYVPNGTETTDLSKVGVIFAKTPPSHELVDVPIHNTAFVIPAGAKHFEVRASGTLLQDVHIWSVYPHMHLRGKTFEFRLTYPDGKTETIMSVLKYDFYWQERYVFEKPVVAPKGTRVDCIAYFDNSEGNPLNVDPKATVRFGLETSDEMVSGHLELTVDEWPSVTRRASAESHKSSEPQ